MNGQRGQATFARPNDKKQPEYNRAGIGQEYGTSRFDGNGSGGGGGGGTSGGPTRANAWVLEGSGGNGSGAEALDWSLPPADPPVQHQIRYDAPRSQAQNDHQWRYQQQKQHQQQQQQYHHQNQYDQQDQQQQHQAYRVDTGFIDDGRGLRPRPEDYRILSMPYPPDLVDSYEGPYSERQVAPSVYGRRYDGSSSISDHSCAHGAYPITVADESSCSRKACTGGDPLAWTVLGLVFKLMVLLVLGFVFVKCLTLQAEVSRLETRLDALEPSMAQVFLSAASTSSSGSSNGIGPSSSPLPHATPGPLVP